LGSMFGVAPSGTLAFDQAIGAFGNVAKPALL
jgi:hypothetical protein